MDITFTLSVPNEVSIKKLAKAMELCESEDVAVLFNDMLDAYLASKSMADSNSVIVGVSSDVKTKGNFELGQTYFHTWSDGGKVVTIKVLEDGFEIQEGSDFELTEVESLSPSHSKRREYLVRTGYIKNEKFVKNYLCTSLSAAASIPRGVQLSGPQSFKKNERLDWTTIVTEAIDSLGGEASLEEIYKEIEKNHPDRLTPHYQNTVRNTIYRSSSDSEFYQGGPDLFKKIGEGRTGQWSLR